jgi:solute carrier family 8 (sodium/calcium exchanger)
LRSCSRPLGMSICDAGTGGGGGGGMLLPAIAGNALPAVLYFLLLAWCLLGMYTLTNRLMQAIVVITSASKWVDCTEDDGEGDEDSSGGLVQREVMRWNPTVAGITLMALGSSAPEILIASVELIGGGFFSGDRDSGDSIGASTIVGSAAFNFFVISAVVVTALPDGDTRVISGREVFFVTTICGLLAYVWLLAVLVVSSPDVVTVWEAGVTVALFPAFVLVWGNSLNLVHPLASMLHVMTH